MGPDADVGLPLGAHGDGEGGEQHGVVVALDQRPKVGAHLPDAVERRPPDAGVGVGEAREDEFDDLREVLPHLLGDPLTRLRYSHQASHPIPPVLLVLEKRRNVPKHGWHEPPPPERNRHTVESLLPNLQIAHAEPPPLVLLLRLVPAVSLGVLRRPLLDIHVGVQVVDHEAEGDGNGLVDKVGDLLHHAGGLLAQLHQKVQRQLPGRRLERLRHCHLHDCLHNLPHIRPKESRVLRREIDHLVQPRLRPLLVLPYRPHHNG
mmetsp:Transcript_5357/g.12872  ORF Transcript_5357/g.12872 Transcript_5357/m.12872 type:complete len:262 (-) Transcript_5357:592-1377(-)